MAANTNNNLISSQEINENDEMSSPRLMRKAQTREGLVDIPNLLAEQGRKAVILTSNEVGRN